MDGEKSANGCHFLALHFVLLRSSTKLVLREAEKVATVCHFLALRTGLGRASVLSMSRKSQTVGTFSPSIKRAHAVLFWWLFGEP